MAQRLGYSAEDLAAIPEGANLGLGCGNPEAFAELRSGETVVDLGAGAGLDCFLAARAVGPTGRVIGVDMTPEMVQRARENAARHSYAQVEFRLGEIEHLPVADNTADVILSNCVINLAPDKAAVFREALRVLKPGGRLAISDTVTTAPLPEEARKDLALWSECIAGALPIGELEEIIRGAGFEQVRVEPREESRAFIREWAPGRRVEEYLVSARIQGVKPGA
ncbi:MAG: arsenite methyltransferase [Anaerolineae bacterium]